MNFFIHAITVLAMHILGFGWLSGLILGFAHLGLKPQTVEKARNWCAICFIINFVIFLIGIAIAYITTQDIETFSQWLMSTNGNIHQFVN